MKAPETQKLKESLLRVGVPNTEALLALNHAAKLEESRNQWQNMARCMRSWVIAFQNATAKEKWSVATSLAERNDLHKDLAKLDKLEEASE